jgi:vanillate O-demethylase ferredoxin subunit
LIRQYSLWGDPADRERYRIAVLRERSSRGGSAAVHEALEAGQTIRIGAPRNSFPIVDESSRSFLFAGGIGITPLLAMAHRFVAVGSPFELHYYVRSRRRAAFLEHLRQAHFKARAHIHVDEESDGPPSLSSHVPAREPDAHLYICGPAGFTRALREVAEDKGWHGDQVHWESFSPGETTEAATCFIVEAAASGVTVKVPPDRSIAHVLMDAGVDVLTSCEQGVCGACLTRVIEGVPDHRDAIQTREERAANTHITICCSRAKSGRLVLDI